MESVWRMLLFEAATLVLALLTVVGSTGRTGHEASRPLADHVNETLGVQRRDVGFHRKLIVSTVLESPYMMLKANSPFLAGNERFEGHLADILRQVATSIGFQYEIRLSRDGRHGELNANGMWDGTIGEILSGEADLAAAALIITDQRRARVDFTEPFLSLRSSALLLKPSPLQSLSPTSSNTTHHPSRAPASWTQRRPITTSDQLFRSDVPFGVVRDSVTHRTMAAASDPLVRQAWTRLARSESSFVMTVPEGVYRARHERYAFIVDTPMAEYISGQAPCDLYATEPFLDVMRYAFALAKPPPGRGEGVSRRAEGDGTGRSATGGKVRRAREASAVGGLSRRPLDIDFGSKLVDDKQINFTHPFESLGATNVAVLTDDQEVKGQARRQHDLLNDDALRANVEMVRNVKSVTANDISTTNDVISDTYDVTSDADDVITSTSPRRRQRDAADPAARSSRKGPPPAVAGPPTSSQSASSRGAPRGGGGPTTEQYPRLRESIDQELRRLQHTGEMQAMYLRWWRDECAGAPGGSRAPSGGAGGEATPEVHRRYAPHDKAWTAANSGTCCVGHLLTLGLVAWWIELYIVGV